ncbi:DUF305 domain-containing protein [Streptomyces sp. NPDC088387]|uniref:DUF305 domain-containing protein n=1 Tax=Streptomyces sp. NPDC088387 TaxID=3365859 RepID=UPI0037F13411
MTAHRSFLRRAAFGAAVAGTAVVLAACASGSADGGSAGHGGHTGSTAAPSASGQSNRSDESNQSDQSDQSDEHNAADVSFAQGMIPHHRQAVEMAGLAATRAGSSEVKELAEEIRKAQDPEIETMTGWLRAWGEQVPADGGVSGHGGHSMAGMMTDQEMDGLEKASGEAFDRAFLTFMVEHHEGAVEMAGTEQRDGAHGPARELAGAVVTAQTAEIARMNKLLGTG